MRVTEFISSAMPKQSPRFRAITRLKPANTDLPTLRAQLPSIVAKWLSHKLSTEEMIGSSKNGASPLSYLRQINVVHKMFDVGRMGCKEHPYLAATPEAIVLLNCL